MQQTKPAQAVSQDYVDTYEQAIHEVISACGSKQAANKLLDELHAHYEKTDAELKALRRELPDGQEYNNRKEALLSRANHEVRQIIEKRLPHIGSHVEELIIGTSLAVTAAMMPVAKAAAMLVAATSIVAIGSSYYIGFKLLRNWKAISGKERMAGLAGIVGPKHINLPRIHSLIRKK